MIPMFHGQNRVNNLGYGRLYNWYAVDDARVLAPVNSRVPTLLDISVLKSYLGDSSIVGGKLKEAGFSHWDSPNTGADNSSGFTALPGGYRRADGTDYLNLRTDAFFWLRSEFDSYTAFVNQMNYLSSAISQYDLTKKTGFSVRCICTTSNPTVTDVDGNVYNTVVIGTQRWFVQNLKVTKYRNGDDIPNITGAGAWDLLTTGAMCAYDNNEGNV